MSFEPLVDFFRKKDRIYLTSKWLLERGNNKLTGTKIPLFFRLPIAHCPNTPYEIWGHVFNLPGVVKVGDIKKKEKDREIEEKIKKYLEDQLGKNWTNYPLDITDIFDSDQLLGGVPDGVEFDEHENVLSILEIKTISDTKSRRDDARFQQVLIGGLLQLSLYLHLKHIDVGYICICYLKNREWQSINSKLIQNSCDIVKVSEKLNSWIEEIGICEYEYELLEVYRSQFLDGNEISVFKIKVNLEKYEKLLGKLSDWFKEHQKVSPKLTDKEIKRFWWI